MNYEIFQQMIQAVKEFKPLPVPIYIKELKTTVLFKPPISNIVFMAYNEQDKING